VEERRSQSRSLVLLVLLLLAVPAGPAACGGGEKQDENEPEGTYKVDVISASFPGRQRLGETVRLRIQVQNQGQQELPNLAISVEGFNQRVDDPTLAKPIRNIWIVNTPPFNSESAYTDTWTLGEVPAGATRTADWHVTAVRAGTYSLRYQVSAGIDGKAKAELPDGAPARGSFIARITRSARNTQID
jgi:hypothetical protein